MVRGYGVEQDFDLAAEQEEKRNRMWWVIFGGTALCILYLFTGRPFATQIFQGWMATSLFYGDNFYVSRGKDLRKLWLWKAILATVPIHVLYLSGIFWLDKALPQLMTKVVIFLPVIALGYAIESIKMEAFIDRFKPEEAVELEDR
jgi:hypothetical protein